MSGPSLQLGVNAAGQDTLIGLNQQLGALRANLTALKTGKVDFTSLSSANADLKKFGASIAEDMLSLRTSFAELVETIKGGMTKAAEETAVGGAKVRSAKQAEMQQMQALYEKALAQGKTFTATELTQLREGGIKLLEADRQIVAARLAVNRQAAGALGQVSNPARSLASTAASGEIDAAYAQHQQQIADQAAAIRASAFIRAETEADAAIEKKELQSFSMFAARERKLAEDRVALALENAKLTASGIAAADGFARQQNGARSQSITTARVIAQAAPAYAASADASFAAEAEAVAASKAAAWIQAETRAQSQINQTELELARGFAVIEREAAATKLAAAKAAQSAEAAGLAEYDAFVLAVEKEEAKDAAAVRAAADRLIAEFDAAAARVKAAEARYQAAAKPNGNLSVTQANIQILARSQLQQGITPAVVEQNFGTTAASAAQAAGSINALRDAHKQAGAAAEEHLPKLKLLSAGMNDAHSAARGLASGFGAMFLTWGNIAPLLAGAALSNAFVQTVKEGAAVEQVLSVIKYQSEETDSAVDGLRARLLALSAVGPQGPKEIAEAMKALSLAGLTAAEVAVSVKDALTLSVVGEMPAQKAAESLVAISTAYGYSVGQFSRVNDVIAKTAAVSMSSVSGMTESFRVSSVVAQQYGVSLEDMATALALVANIGVRNQNAGTSVTQFFAGLEGTTKKGSDGLKKLGIDSLDATGKMRSLDDIAQQLVKSLSKLDQRDQTKAVAAVFNNRGQKTEGAIVTSMITPAKDENTGETLRRADGAIKDAAGNIVTVFQETQRKIEESYGFAIIAMAGMSLSAENQMKSVASSFQGALVQAFQDLQPTILVISKTLRDTFNSQDFKAGLNGIVESVGNLAVALAKNLDIVLEVAKAWLIWKGALIGASVFSTVTTGVMGLAAAFGVLRASTLLAATGFTVLQASMGLVGLLLGGLAAAWIYYKTTTAQSVTSAAAVAATSTAEMIRTLEAESDKIEARNQLLRDGVSAREADIRMAAVQAQADMAQVQKKATDEATSNISAKAKELEAAKARLASLPEKPSAIDDALFNTSNLRAQAQKQVNRLQDEYNGALRQGGELIGQQTKAQRDLKLAQDVVRAAQMEANRLDTPKPSRLPGGTDKFDTTKVHPGAEERDEIGAAKKIYGEQERDLKVHYDQMNKIEALRHSSGQISDTQYEIEQEAREKVYYDQRVADLEAFTIKVAAARERLSTLKPTDAKRVKAEIEAEEMRINSLKQELVLAQQFTKEQEKAKEFKRDHDLDIFIKKQEESLDLSIRENAEKAKGATVNLAVRTDKAGTIVSRNVTTLAPEEAQVEEARIAAQGRLNGKLVEQKDLLEQAQRYAEMLASAQTAAMLAGNPHAITGDDGSLLAAAQAKVERLQQEITLLQNKQFEMGNKAAEATAKLLVPQWQKMVEGWQDATKQMRVIYDEMVTNFISQGESVFANFMKTGKFTASSLLDAIRDTLVKNLYQTTLAPVMSQIGQFFTNTVLGNRPAIGTGAPSGVDLAAQNTTVSLTTLNDVGITPTIGVFESLTLAANQLGAAMASAAGGSGGGWLSGLFGGGGSGNHNIDMGNQEGSYPVSIIGGDALGAAYNGARYAFAKGSPFTNNVYAQPTRFRFAGGAAMGEMGEAGPEAVMPLKRGPDGSLGVQNHGGAGGSSNVSVVVENHSGSTAKVKESKKADGSREIRVLIDAALEAVKNDIHSGGPVSSAIESQYGTNRANGLARR